MEEIRAFASVRSRLCLVLLAAGLLGIGHAQDSTLTLRPKQQRATTVAIGSAVLISGALVGLDRAWYSDYDRTPFHVFNDGDEWRGMDKSGHFFSVYTTAQWGYGMFKWAGASEKLSTWVGGSLGWAFLAGVEVLDGTSAAWGFSPWDMVANTAGAGLFMAQQCAWGDQRIRLKWSGHLTGYATQRPDLLGDGLSERLLKDYNGQTYWLSASPVSFRSPGPHVWPAWLNLAMGYGAEGMVSARPDEALDDQGPGSMNARSQFYLSFDMDLHRIPTRNSLVRTVLDVLNCVKFPAPALEVGSDGSWKGHWLYF